MCQINIYIGCSKHSEKAYCVTEHDNGASNIISSTSLSSSSVLLPEQKNRKKILDDENKQEKQYNVGKITKRRREKKITRNNSSNNENINFPQNKANLFRIYGHNVLMVQESIKSRLRISLNRMATFLTSTKQTTKIEEKKTCKIKSQTSIEITVENGRKFKVKRTTKTTTTTE